MLKQRNGLLLYYFQFFLNKIKLQIDDTEKKQYKINIYS